MINKQKVWFLTLFSLILILSVYYITMPNDLIANVSSNEKSIVTTKKASVDKTSSDYITALQVESDEERSLLAAEYNEILTNSTKDLIIIWEK